MLNHLRIGTKLFGGFAIVLLLLLAVWLVGWYATSQIVGKTKELSTASNLAQGGLNMRNEIYKALFNAANEALYKDQKAADEVQNIVEHFQQNFGDLREVIKSDIAREAFDAVMKHIKDFGESDAEYWKADLERARTVKDRDEFSKATLDSIGTLLDMIMEVTAEKHATTQDGKQYFEAERFALRNNAGHLSTYVRDINAWSLEYQLEFDMAKKSEIREQIKETYKKIDTTIVSVGESLSSDMGKKKLAEFNENREKWKTAMDKLIGLIDDLLKIDSATTDIATNMTKKIDEMLVAFNNRAKGALDDATETGGSMGYLLMGISIVAVIVGLIISLILTNNITVGLKHAVGAMRIIADEGNVSIVIPESDLSRGDEVGDMAKAFKNIVSQFQNVEQLANNLAEGNYDTETKVRGDLDTMNINLNKMLDQVNQVLAEIGEGVKQVATGSGEVSSAAQALSSGAQESAASLEEITASMSEISSQTKANAESAGQARDLAQKANTAATNGQDAMKQMTSAMGRITQNSNEIQRVIKVIDDIAFQTNLLALNAAVEAARAGQHGKGFAVVAEEVRNLAARSAKAAKETSELIAKSGHEIEHGAEVATKTADVLNTIVEQIEQTTNLVAGIAVASNEQAQGVNQVTLGLQQIDAVTQQNTAAAEESASAASEMSGMAVNLQGLVSHFKLRGQSRGNKPAAVKPAPKPAAIKPAVHAHKPMPTEHGHVVAKPPIDDNWGGGGNAGIHIDLDTKDFGKY